MTDLPILIAAGAGGPFVIVATFLLGLAAAVLGYVLVQAVESEDLEQGNEWRYDVSRINSLRKVDTIYRVFQPVIIRLARMNRNLFRPALPEIQREIHAAGLPRFWLAEEYLARAEIIAVFLCPFYIYLCLEVMGPPGVVMALVLTALTVYLLRRRLASLARTRLKHIKRRLPFLLDLLTLLMEAGSTFLQALEEGIKEYRGHPLAQEFGRVLADVNMGKTRTQAFQAMQARLSDDEINSIIGSIVQGEQLGTPLARIFRTQADILRLKRSQRAEAVAGEAGVNMLLPGVLVMMATVLIILGPFLVNFLVSGLVPLS